MFQSPSPSITVTFNYRHLQITVTFKLPPPSDYHDLQITVTFKFPSPPLNYRHIQITVTFKLPLPSNYRHIQITVTFKLPLPSNYRHLQLRVPLPSIYHLRSSLSKTYLLPVRSIVIIFFQNNDFHWAIVILHGFRGLLVPFRLSTKELIFATQGVGSRVKSRDSPQGSGSIIRLGVGSISNIAPRPLIVVPRARWSIVELAI